MKLDKSKSADKLTLKQEAFAMAYVESGNASKAYKTVYNVNDNASDNSRRIRPIR